jgi:hypothetical protein
MNKFPDTGDVTVQALGYKPVTVYVRMNASGEVFIGANYEGEKFLCDAKEEKEKKKRPEFYEPGMRFKRTGYEDDEYVLVSGSLFDMYKTNYAMLANIATGNNWWSAAKVANHARITREEFAKIVNYYTAEFELIEKEPKI